MNNTTEIKLQIRAIFVTKFDIELKEEFIKVAEETKGTFTNYTFEITCVNKGFVQDNLMNTEIIVSIFLDKEKKVQLGKIHITNIFEVPDLKTFYIEEKNLLDLPRPLELTLISISLSHARAIILTKCAGTFLQNAIIPVMNPMDFIDKKKEEEKTSV